MVFLTFFFPQFVVECLPTDSGQVSPVKMSALSEFFSDRCRLYWI